jgi:diguanylate cyclase (GGDEF)-like protein/PAS domain S-box-containing protein
MTALRILGDRLAVTAAVLTLFSGLAVCAAWLAGAQDLTRLTAGSSIVRFNTGVLFCIASAGLMAALSRRRRLAAAAAVGTGVLGALTLVQYSWGIDLGIDRFVLDTPDHGRMAPNTAATFVLAGGALLLLAATPRRPWVAGAAQVLGALVVAVGGFALLGYGVGLTGAFQWAGLTRMATLTALSFTILGIGLIASAIRLSEARAWYEVRALPATSGFGLAALSVLGWYALNHSPESARDYMADVVTGLGLLAAALLAGAIAQARRMRLQAQELLRTNAVLVSAQAAVRESESRLQNLLDGLQTAVVVHGPDTAIQYVNSAAVGILGLTRDQLLGKTAIDPYWHFAHEDGTPMTVAEYPVSLVFGSRAPLHDYVVGVRAAPAAPTRWVLVNAVPNVDASGRIRQVVVSFIDISERTQRTQQLEKLVLTDALTGLATRRHFIAAAEREIAACRRAGGELSLLVLDVDHFKRVNDDHGHAVGDSVLVQLGATARSVLRQADLAGRIGGEEFGVLLPQTGARGAHEIAERLRAAVAATPAGAAGGRPVSFTVSIGVATLEPGDESLAALMDRADQAMYQAKREGRDRVCVRLTAAAGGVPGRLTAPPPPGCPG